MTTPSASIYHITHVDNLAGIVKEGGLHCDAVCIARQLSVSNIGYRHIKQRRLSRPVPVAAQGFLGDYVPFNFCSRSVMLYVVNQGHQDYSGGQSEVVHVVSSIGTATSLQRAWAFTDRHAELAHAAYYDDLRQLHQVDWSVMPLIYWSTDPLTKELRQAEFLVHQFFPWTAVERIAVISKAMAVRVAQVLAGSAHQPRIDVERNWYY